MFFTNQDVDSLILVSTCNNTRFLSSSPMTFMKQPLKTLRSFGFVALLLSLAPMTGASEPPPVKIYVMAGQSNMAVSAGPGAIAETAPEVKTWIESEDNDVLFFWRNIENTQHNEPGERVGEKTQWGYEAIIAYELSRYWEATDPAQEFVIVKVNKGATGMGWWTPAREEAHALYLALHDAVLGAVEAIESSGKAWEGGAFFWHQGENDANPAISDHHATVYTERLEALVDKTADENASGYPGLRPLLQSPDMPVVVGRIKNYGPGRNMSIYRKNLWDWVVAEDNQPAAMINCDDFTTTDGTHYDAPSIVLGGRRFSDAYLNLVAPAEHPFPPRYLPDRRFFIQPVEGRLFSRTPGAVIHYTDDGSEPTPDSPVAPETMTVSATTTLKAIAVDADGHASRVAVMPFEEITDVWPALDVANPSTVIEYTRYAYDVAEVPETFPNLDDLPVIETGEGTPAIESGQAIRATGYFDLPIHSVYRFRPIVARGGQNLVRMTIDDREVLGDNGLTEIHGATSTTLDFLPLAKGLHQFTLEVIHPTSWTEMLRFDPLIKGRDYEDRHFGDALPDESPDGNTGGTSVQL